MARMTEDELRALTDSEMRASVGFWGGKLAEQRRKAEYYYLAIPKGDLAPPEVEGRSQVVSPDVRNTIEAMLPQLMVKFTGGDSVVEFEPQAQCDEKTAQQVTDYLNYLFFKKNNGHNITYTMFKDALLQKRGIVKVWWDNRVEETKEEYRAMSEVEMAQILEDKELEPISHKEYPDEEDAKQRQEAIGQLTQQLQQAMQAQTPQAMQAAQQMQAQIAHIQSQPPVMLHDLEVKRKKTSGKITIENVPPEEFLISRKAKDIPTAPFVGHRVARTMSELKSMGYKNIDNISSDDGSSMLNAERTERLSWDDEEAGYSLDNDTSDESQKLVWVTECYIRCDFDGDGISELRKVTRAGNQILDNEVVDVTPFCSVCPIPLPHKFFGLSVADLGFESQLTKTSILRARLDNMYLEVNGRYWAVDGQVNLDDLLTSRPGGVVRMKQAGMVGRLDQGASNNAADGMLEYMEGFLESATGWTRNSQGNAPGDLQGTATGMNIITNKDDMRLDLIARNFAEGFCDIFRLMLKLVCQHQNQKAEIRLNGEWLAIDPREWRNQFDTTINVGLGVGNKDQRIGHLMALRAQQDVGLPMGVATPLNVYNANAEIAKELGYKSPDKFFTDPTKNPPPQQTPLEIQLEQLKQQGKQGEIHAALQADVHKFQAEQQFKAQELQLMDSAKQRESQMALEVQASNDMRDAQRQAEADARAHQLAMEQIASNERIAAAKIAADERLAAMDGDVKLQSEGLKRQTALDTAQLSAQAGIEQARMSSDTTRETAQLSAQTTMHSASMAKAEKAEKPEKEEKKEAPEKKEKPDTSVIDAIKAIAAKVDAIHTHSQAPRKIVRDADGRAVGVDVGGVVKSITRGKDGRIEGV